MRYKGPFFRNVIGPLLTLSFGVTFGILARFGVIVPHNEIALFTLIVFSGFYAGILSGYASIAVAGFLYVLALSFPNVFPDFTGHAWKEVGSLAGTLPLVVLMVGLLRQRMDERVRESEEGYRAVVENIDEVFFLIAADFKKLFYISPGYEKVFGRPSAELYADPSGWMSSVHPEDREVLTAAIGKAFADDQPTDPVETPFRIARPDGSTRWLTAKGVILRDAIGKPDRFAGIVRDVSREVLAQAAEKAASVRLGTVLRSSPVAIFSTDKDGILTMREGRGGEKAGVKPGQGIGGSYFEEFKDIPEHLENVRRAMRGETLTAQMQVRKGFFNIVYASIRDAKGEPDGMVGVATDITERAQAEEKVRDLSVLKNRFITVVSHQLRTPLSAVRWNAETLLDEKEAGKLKVEQKRLLQDIRTSSTDVITRIGDFLLALDIEEGRLVMAKEDFDLETIWEPVMAAAKRRCEEKKLSFVFVAPPDGLPRMEADPEKIIVVMEKLLDNAITYTTQGSVSVRISQEKGVVRFEVADTGIGIPESEQSKLFHRFFRASNAMRIVTDASGLGLYVAWQFVEQHGGTFGFTSKEGIGSTFWFEIPSTSA